MGQRRKAVAKFRLAIGHDCLLKHLQWNSHVSQAPFCTLCDIWEGMDAGRCTTLKGSSLCDLYWQIVRVHYFVRGGFVGYRSRASSKHLSPHLPVGSLDSSGVKQGLRWIGSCTCGRRIYKETDTRCCCCFRDVTLQLSPSLMELFR
ncbi:hypothetical protein TNCV_4864901 [Trichonephila clavipes]|nr:hypothetical protein TNCV_4864901 [Trichonephila clavipes]